jgi:hypothetical protein
MSQSSPPKKTTEQFKSCLFEVCKLPVEIFRKSTDGRKWKAGAGARKALAVQLAGYADANGTSIRPSIKTLVAQTGFSRAKVFRQLDDLKELGFMERTGRHGQRGAAIRRLMLPERPSTVTAETASLGVEDTVFRVSDSILEVSDSTLRVSDSSSQSLTAMRHNLPLQTCPTDPPSKAVQKTDELRDGMANAFSKARPEENLNWVGFSDIEALAAELGSELLIKVWQCWLKTRDTRGLKFHFQWFRKEFEATREQVQQTEQRAAVSSANKELAAESQAYERGWIDGINALVAQSFLDGCPDREAWKAKFREWIEVHPASPVLIECGGKLVSVDETKEQIESIQNLAARYFDQREQAGVLY